MEWRNLTIWRLFKRKRCSQRNLEVKEGHRLMKENWRMTWLCINPSVSFFLEIRLKLLGICSLYFFSFTLRYSFLLECALRMNHPTGNSGLIVLWISGSLLISVWPFSQQLKKVTSLKSLLTKDKSQLNISKDGSPLMFSQRFRSKFLKESAPIQKEPKMQKCWDLLESLDSIVSFGCSEFWKFSESPKCKRDSKTKVTQPNWTITSSKSWKLLVQFYS